MYARELKFNSRTRTPAKQPLNSIVSPDALHCNSHFHNSHFHGFTFHAFTVSHFTLSHFDTPYPITSPILSMSISPSSGFPKNTTFGTRKKINGLSLSRFAKK